MKTIYRIYIAAVLLTFAAVSASGQSIDEYERSKARLEKEIAIIDKQLSTNASKSRSMLSQLSLIRTKISSRQQLIKESDRQIRQYNDKIYLTQKQINRLNARIDTLSDHYSRLVMSAYKNRDPKIWYMYILASDDLGQAFRRYGYFKNLSSSMRVQADKIREAKEELEIEKKAIMKLKKEAEALRESRAKELTTLRSEESSANRTVGQLKKNRRKYEAELASKRKRMDALDKEIARLVAAAMKESSSKSGGKKVEIDYKLAAEFSKNKGKLPWPADGPVVEKFGQHYHPVFTSVKMPFNNGISIAVNPSSKVTAVFDGVVKSIGVMPGYSTCVLVQHGNYFSFYCKLKSVSVGVGDKIKTGQAIGTVDSINGESQLYLQIWENQKPQDPMIWLRPR